MSFQALLEMLGLLPTAAAPPATATFKLVRLTSPQLLVPVPLSGPVEGFVGGNIAFPHTLTLKVDAKVTPAPGSTASLKFELRVDRRANPEVSGEVAQIVPVPSSGDVSVQTTVNFDSALPLPRVLNATAKLSQGSTTVAVRHLQLQVRDLQGFVNLVAPEESKRPAGNTLEFLAAVRKVYQDGRLFDWTVGRHALVPPLFAPKTPDRQRLAAFTNLFAGGAWVDIGHVLVGVEGAARFSPQPRFPIPKRPDTALTWAGDIGTALEVHAWEKYFLKLPNPQTIAQILATRAEQTELYGDLDGVNLAAELDPALPLVDNLLAYYAHAGSDRFHLFLANTKDAGGAPALTLESGVSPPKLTAASRTFIAQEAIDFARGALAFRVFPKIVPEPPEVTEMLKPTSPEAQEVATYLASFVEQGLQAEGP